MIRLCFFPGLFFLLSLLPLPGKCQNLSLANQAEQVTIQEFSGAGYRAVLDFDYKSVKKDFWRFCNGFAKLENMRKYYEVVIPPSSDNADGNIKIWVELKPLKEHTQMKALLNPQEMDANQVKKYTPSADNLIQEFKIFFYQKWIQDSIEELEKENRKLSKKESRLASKLIKAKQKASAEAKIATLENARNAAAAKLSQGIARLEEMKDKLREVK
jgi:DNA repair exonuclease SbcCD ATPase subunit